MATTTTEIHFVGGGKIAVASPLAKVEKKLVSTSHWVLFEQIEFAEPIAVRPNQVTHLVAIPEPWASKPWSGD